MTKTPSQIPIERGALSRFEKRISFLYVERATLNRDGNSLAIADSRGIALVPATQLAVILLGPGVSVTHSAMGLLGDSGVSTVWVGERGVRYYASGRPPAKTSKFAELQAKIWANQRSRLDCARRMYQMRFPGEDVTNLTMSQLRGREGARMKRVYASLAKQHKIPWNRRNYDPHDFAAGDPINQALTASNAALYGVTQAVVCGLGCIPSLGMVHTGTDRAFVYDIADLYKAEVALPAAFEAVAADLETAGVSVRRLMRSKIVEHNLMQRLVTDLQSLLLVPEQDAYSDVDLLLWDQRGSVSTGTNWSSKE